MTTQDTREVVLRYFATVGDLSSTEEDLTALVSPEAVVIEHPNPVTPNGAVRTAEQNLAGFRAGKALLSAQSLDVHEVLVSGDRAAVRATWRGTVGVDAGRYRKGTELVAHLGGFVTVRDGRVVEHETFDCYEPFAGEDRRAPGAVTGS